MVVRNIFPGFRLIRIFPNKNNKNRIKDFAILRENTAEKKSFSNQGYYVFNKWVINPFCVQKYISMLSSIPPVQPCRSVTLSKIYDGAFCRNS